MLIIRISRYYMRILGLVGVLGTVSWGMGNMENGFKTLDTPTIM